MKLRHLLRISACSLVLGLHAPAQAQLAPVNEAGFTAGHTHLAVPDMEEHWKIWERLGGVERNNGGRAMLSFPGMYILFMEREPGASSAATTVHHIGFSIRDYAQYRALLDEIGASFFLDDSDTGHIIADLPAGVRVEFLVDSTQAEPIRFHHTHVATRDAAALQEWYVQVFGATAGERRGLPSAIIPGGRVDFLQVDDGTTPAPSSGNSIDHISFDVSDMKAFAARLAKLGIDFTVEPRAIPNTPMTIAFLTDPAGTYIEITEGLMAAQQ